MNIIAFSVDTTNIFPASNTTKGGQLLTEFNLRSRESVATDKNVQYMIGPSYTHSESDFYVSVMNDATGYFPNVDDSGNSSTTVTSSILKINEGRAIVNGHFIESLTPVVVDLTEQNRQAKLNGRNPVEGHLSIGLRIMYSTEPTMAGSIKVENKNDMFEGIQIVILPTTDFITPSDAPTDKNKVTAHLLLATFDYYDGKISNIVQNFPGKCSVIDAWRINNVDELLTDTYLTKTGLNYKKLYTYAGKGKNPSDPNSPDTWCDSTDALMVFDAAPVPFDDKDFVDNASDQGLALIEGTNSQQVNELLNRYPEATFIRLNSEKVALVLPHKQVDYPIHSEQGNRQLYGIKVYALPVADYVNNTAGTVDSNYTNHIKTIAESIRNLYNLPSGKQRGFVPILNSREQGIDDDYLPILNQKWEPGDYILVGQDNTISIDETTYTQPPSSLYVVLPGNVESLLYAGVRKDIDISVGDNNPPLEGRLLDYKPWGGEAGTTPSIDSNVYDDITNELYFPTMNTYKGIPGKDYFALDVYNTNAEGKVVSFDRYYYAVFQAGLKTYTDPPIWLTDEIPLATTDRVGGFLNVEDTALDAGYVYRDDEGHLRLLDYSLLRSGTLAYQLGQDFETSSGLTIAALQQELDEYVNERVAFPNAVQKTKILLAGDAGVPNEINVIIHLSEPTEDEIASGETTLTIRGIDSRFNTHVNLQILGSSTSDVNINIVDCEKIRIDSSSLASNAIINVYRSCLYYDYTILNRLSYGVIEDLRLWYIKRYVNDPDLVVDCMTVSEINTPTLANTVDFYDDTAPNDNHFSYGVKSLTFGSDGVIIGCSLLVRNDSTSNVAEGKFIISDSFTIPQGSSLMYPEKLMRKQLKVTGHFVSSYHITSPDTWMIQDTSFTAMSQYYEVDSNLYVLKPGTISFLTDAFYVSNTNIKTGTGTTVDDKSIDGWEPAGYHIFYGGALS